MGVVFLLVVRDPLRVHPGMHMHVRKTVLVLHETVKSMIAEEFAERRGLWKCIRSAKTLPEARNGIAEPLETGLSS